MYAARHSVARWWEFWLVVLRDRLIYDHIYYSVLCVFECVCACACVSVAAVAAALRPPRKWSTHNIEKTFSRMRSRVNWLY